MTSTNQHTERMETWCVVKDISNTPVYSMHGIAELERIWEAISWGILSRTCSWSSGCCKISENIIPDTLCLYAYTFVHRLPWTKSLAFSSFQSDLLLLAPSEHYKPLTKTTLLQRWESIFIFNHPVEGLILKASILPIQLNWALWSELSIMKL